MVFCTWRFFHFLQLLTEMINIPLWFKNRIWSAYIMQHMAYCVTCVFVGNKISQKCIVSATSNFNTKIYKETDIIKVYKSVQNGKIAAFRQDTSYIVSSFSFQCSVVCPMFVFCLVLLAMVLSVFRLNDFCLHLGIFEFLLLYSDVSVYRFVLTYIHVVLKGLNII